MFASRHQAHALVKSTLFSRAESTKRGLPEHSQPSLLEAGTGGRSAGVLTSDLAKALNLLSIFCLLGSCRTQHNYTNILVEAPLPDHPSRGLCELHICQLR